jgi:hypothetical protein
MTAIEGNIFNLLRMGEKRTYKYNAVQYSVTTDREGNYFKEK